MYLHLIYVSAVLFSYLASGLYFISSGNKVVDAVSI